MGKTTWTKRSTKTGKFVDQKKTPAKKKFKGVRKERWMGVPRRRCHRRRRRNGNGALYRRQRIHAIDAESHHRDHQHNGG
jgi:hypothetical protein